MPTVTTSAAITAVEGFFDEDTDDLERLDELIDTVTPADQYRYAVGIEREVVIYDIVQLEPLVATTAGRRAVMTELARAFNRGPGIVVIRNAINRAVLDRANVEFDALIDAQNASGAAAGDYFVKAGANDRVWNALEKLAVDAPEVFVAYYACDAIALAATAWLGPGYQITSQLNQVRPGGTAQRAHRDYPLGFTTAAQAAAYPVHVHSFGPMLTLQGAVAHRDMPVESGPTKYLPHSHKLHSGYVAWHQHAVRDRFEERFVQLPLDAGDAVFFNPAVFHAAGSNRTSDVMRLANLLQIVSPFVKAMESIDHTRMVRAVYPALLALSSQGSSPQLLANAITAAADGYSFPTNLDRDIPTEGRAAESQAELVMRAVRERLPQEALDEMLAAAEHRRRTAG